MDFTLNNQQRLICHKTQPTIITIIKKNPPKAEILYNFTPYKQMCDN